MEVPGKDGIVRNYDLGYDIKRFNEGPFWCVPLINLVSNLLQFKIVKDSKY